MPLCGSVADCRLSDHLKDNDRCWNWLTSSPVCSPVASQDEFIPVVDGRGCAGCWIRIIRRAQFRDSSWDWRHLPFGGRRYSYYCYIATTAGISRTTALRWSSRRHEPFKSAAEPICRFGKISHAETAVPLFRPARASVGQTTGCYIIQRRGAVAAALQETEDKIREVGSDRSLLALQGADDQRRQDVLYQELLIEHIVNLLEESWISG